MEEGIDKQCDEVSEGDFDEVMEASGMSQDQMAGMDGPNSDRSATFTTHRHSRIAVETTWWLAVHIQNPHQYGLREAIDVMRYRVGLDLLPSSSCSHGCTVSTHCPMATKAPGSATISRVGPESGIFCPQQYFNPPSASKR